ncbi:MAG: pseudaminic acid cytidylyltransferase [Desulfurivibrio sp.]|nr:pseudaminic acid cytidylyltransferase [Desulfurivibrio sp.]
MKKVDVKMHGGLNVAVIPARGGSKRIPGKNIKPFAGKPIIAWSIEAALASGLFDAVIVSTDSDDIAAVAREHGAETPFVRPAELADDYATTAVVVYHALEWLRDNRQLPDNVCCFYATAPFVTPAMLQESFSLLQRSDASSVFPVTSFPFPILRALTINEQGRVTMMWPEYELTRSNDLPDAYHDAGQFYWLNVPNFLQNGKLYADAVPFVIPRWRVQDIDTLEDWQMAEHLFANLQDSAKK